MNRDEPTRGVPDDLDGEPEAASASSRKRAKAALRRLADGDDEAVVERAAAAVEDLDRAAAFVQAVGVQRLAAAVDATEDPARRARGRRAMRTFQRFRRAAAGERQAADAETDAPPEHHFRPAHGTDLRRDGQSPPR